jgi:hypothetical protein
MNPEDEKRARELIEALKRQSQGAMMPPNLPRSNQVYTNNDLNPADEQRGQQIISELQTGVNTQPATTGSAPSGGGFSPAKTRGDVCPQCGTIHPPLREGEQCPNKKIVIKSKDQDEKVFDPNKFLVDMRNIIISQVEARGIKNVDYMFKQLTVELTKFLESYEDPKDEPKPQEEKKGDQNKDAHK